ncbi:MAG TPA: Fur family transcriptional regulator [Anaerolineaceae bacterium]
MDDTLARLTRELAESGLRPSYQRIKVLEYLHEKKGHPTVDDIYHALAVEIPTLSRTTVYNTLHSFVEAGLARMVHIDGAEARYDVTLHPHGHFQCVGCGSITNFSINIDVLAFEGLNRFEVREKDVYFRGLCPNCIGQQDLRRE